MKNLLTALVGVLLLISYVNAQQAEPPIRVWADGASYKYFQDPTKSYVEVYVALQRKDIQFEEQEGVFNGKAYLYLETMDESGKMVDSLGRWLAIGVKFLEDAYKEDIRVFEVIPCLLTPGRYKMRLTVVDGISKRTGISTFELAVKDYSSENLDISDMEIAYEITTVVSDTVLSSLVKAGRKIIPNPNRYFSNDDTLVYYYTEVYNIAVRPEGSDEIEVRSTLLDSYGYELREFPPVREKKPGTTSVISQAIPMRGLPGGDYVLSVRVEDIATGRKVTTAKKFKLIYNFNQITPTMTNPENFTEEDAKLMEQVIRYITTKEEKEQYEELSLEGKKKWLESYWERNNPNPGSKVNSFKNERFRRFIYANYHYSTSSTTRNDGWSSDRGRVYIIYGEPDQVDRNPSVMGKKPYERWFYYKLQNQSGGNYFVFVDEDGYGNYRLVHSTVKGEISNPQYEQLLEEGQN